MRWKPALNAFAVAFGDRFPAAETSNQDRRKHRNEIDPCPRCLETSQKSGRRESNPHDHLEDRSRAWPIISGNAGPGHGRVPSSTVTMVTVGRRGVWHVRGTAMPLFERYGLTPLLSSLSDPDFQS